MAVAQPQRDEGLSDDFDCVTNVTDFLFVTRLDLVLSDAILGNNGFGASSVDSEVNILGVRPRWEEQHVVNVPRFQPHEIQRKPLVRLLSHDASHLGERFLRRHCSCRAVLRLAPRFLQDALVKAARAESAGPSVWRVRVLGSGQDARLKTLCPVAETRAGVSAHSSRVTHPLFCVVCVCNSGCACVCVGE